MKDFLTKLKVGDKVIVDGRYHQKVVKVIRMTQTQIIVEGGSKFRKNDGWAVGCDTFCSACLREGTPEEIHKIVQQNRRSRTKALIENDILNLCNDDEVLTIWNIVKSKTLNKEV